MSIKVQFFASLRERMGQQSLELDFNELSDSELPDAACDVRAVWAQATGNQPMPDNTLCAINMEYVKTDASVKDGDEVAFFPPVTGG